MFCPSEKNRWRSQTRISLNCTVSNLCTYLMIFQEEEAQRLKEEEEKREYEEYLKLKEAFTVDEEGEEVIVDQNVREKNACALKTPRIVFLQSDYWVTSSCSSKEMTTAASFPWWLCTSILLCCQARKCPENSQKFSTWWPWPLTHALDL